MNQAISTIESRVSEISAQALQQRMHAGDAPLLAEILGPSYFAKGHLPGALNLPLEGFSEGAARLLPNKGAEIVVYCASVTCANSHVAARKLVSDGYSNVRVFAGGKAAWVEAGFALVTEG
ncbi:MAG: rhodanese-like domain-containing protein [Polyangiaceae bacterium]